MPVAVLGAVLAAVLAGVAWRRLRAADPDPWLGPLFRHDLARLARRGRQPRFRAAYVLLLLVGLLGAYLSEFSLPGDPGVGFASRPTDPSRLARFGQHFLMVFLFAQAAVVVVLTPVAVGGPVTAEKDRGTFELLRASPLRSRELAVGKLASGLTAVGSVLLAGLPVLALSMLFGGVDGTTLLAGFGVTAAAAASLGAFTLYLAVTRDGLGSVLLTAYATVGLLTLVGGCGGAVPGVGAASPFAALGYMLVARQGGAVFAGVSTAVAFWANAAGFVAVHGLLAVWLTLRAVAKVRPAGPSGRTNPAKPAAPSAVRAVPQRRAFPVPRLGATEDPFRWKEDHFGGRAVLFADGFLDGCGVTLACGLGCVLGGWLATGVLGVVFQGWAADRFLTPAVRVTVVGTVLACGLAAGVLAAGCVARERHRRMLDSLFTLPVDRADILWAKLASVADRVGVWLLVPLAVALVGVAAGGLHPVGLVVGGLVAAAHVGLCAAGGVWLSVRAPTAVRATTVGTVALVLLSVGPVAVAPVLAALYREGFLPGGDALAAVLRAVSPPAVLWDVLTPRADPVNPQGVVAAVGVAGAYGYAADRLWRAAAGRFEEDGKE